MLNDLRFAFRMIRSNLLFSAAIVVTLALSIGVNTTVFTLVNAVLFKPVPIPNGARLVVVANQSLNNLSNRFPISYPDYLDYKKQAKSLDALEATAPGQAIISEANNPPVRYRMVRITTGLFEMVRTPVLLGRSFNQEDAKPGAASVAIISHSVWQTRYGSDPAILNRNIRLNGQPATIVGVMPEGFRFPSGQDIWTPLIPTNTLLDRASRQVNLYGVLREGAPIENASAELAVVAKQLSSSYPKENKEVGISVRTFHQAFNGGNIRTIFFLMLGAVACVLLIACANVANMMLSRALARRREITVRAALGASRWQLIRQLLTECVLLSTAGGIIGLGLANVGVHYFDLATQADRPYWIGFGMDWVAFAYFAGLSIFSGIAFGLLPALRATRVDLTGDLRDGARTSSGPGTGRIAGSLVVVQFALTMILLSGAGLLARSFFVAQTVNQFIPADRIFTARVSLPSGTGEPYFERDARLRFYEELLRKTTSLAGVSSAAISSGLPGTGSDNGDVELEDRPVGNNKTLAVRTAFMATSPAYHALIGLRLREGRAFENLDGDTGREAAIASAEFAARHWPSNSAIGKRFRFLEVKAGQPGPWITIVGICDNLLQSPQEVKPNPLVYLPHRQQAYSGMALLLRADSGSASNLARPALSAAQSIDPDLPLSEVSTVDEALARQRWHIPVFGTVFGSFAIIGLMIAAVGIYAVGAQLAASRTREIGIRMALGATPGGILKIMLSRGLIQLTLGLAIGGAGAAAATGFLSGALFQVSTHDPLVFTSITALLASIGLFACWLPARRAARLDPTTALRDE
jgi:putative ABC transport system permease protein